MAKSAVTLRISLEPKTCREIEISGEASLSTLAEAITSVFGFDFDHMFGFYDNPKNIARSKTADELFSDMGEPVVEHAKSVKKSNVLEAFDRAGRTFTFLFDYGDKWLFKVKRLVAAERVAPKTVWKLIRSEGEAPTQYPESEDDGDDRPFDETYETVKIGGMTVVKLREPK